MRARQCFGHRARAQADATADEIVGLTWDGLKKFDGKTAVYIRPMYWAEHGGYMGVPADPGVDALLPVPL
jgi:hypothetical protein